MQLAVHEPRHQAQLESFSRGWMRLPKALVAEAWNPLAYSLYLGTTLGEGDAVATETGMGFGTRAWTADFLAYYRVAFDQGDFRSMPQWSYGSFKHYTPDAYRLGYLSIAGLKYLSQDPLVMQKALSDGLSKPWRIAPGNLWKRGKKATGERGKTLFRHTQRLFDSLWRQQALQRAPFDTLHPVGRERGRFALHHTSPVRVGGELLALREGYLRNRQLVRVDSTGRIRALRPFATHTSSLYADAERGRIYWSETWPHPRWELAGTSVIRRLTLRGGKVHTLTRKGRLYNPHPTADGTRLAALDCPYGGGTQVVVLDAESGAELARFVPPDTLQAHEPAWVGDSLYVTAISRGGIGLYHVTAGGRFQQVLPPSRQKVVHLRSGTQAGTLEWTSDRDGANALYRFHVREGCLERLLSTRYGASDYAPDGKGGYYCTAWTLQGKRLRHTGDTLHPQQVRWSQTASHPIAECLERQERSLAGQEAEGQEPSASQARFSPPKRYAKAAHGLRFHSWAPLYVNYDKVLSASFDPAWQAVAPGVSLFFQNTLSTFHGMAAYALHRDPDIQGHWRNALHLKCALTGTYPIWEAELDLGDRGAQSYSFQASEEGGHTTIGLASEREGRPFLQATLSMHIPLQWQRGGVLYGFIPRISYVYTNDCLGWEDPQGEILGCVPRRVDLQHLSLSLRGYAMLPRAHSGIYPRLGVGSQWGLNLRPGFCDVFTPSLYGYLYGYLPGLHPSHSVVLTLSGAVALQYDKAPYVEFPTFAIPRGFTAGQGTRLLAYTQKAMARVTVDYALPIYVGDLALGPLFYIRNFVLTPHADYAKASQGDLSSLGVDFTAHFAHFLVLTGSIEAGVRYCRTGGSLHPAMGQRSRHSVEMLFSIDL